MPESSYVIPLGDAKIVRDGTDITVIATSMMVNKSLDAADQLRERNISIEVIDPRTLSPIDTNKLCKSARKTGRVIIVDESPPRCSIAADIAAMVSESTFDSLKAPVKRVTSPHSPVPLSPPLEEAYIPSVQRIIAAAEELTSTS